MTRNRHNFRYAKNKNGKSLLVPKDTDNFIVWDLPDDYDWLHSNPETIDKIILAVSEGATLREVCEEFALPVTAILWRARSDEKFAELLAAARSFRAEHYHDLLAKIAEDAREGSSRSDKVKSDIYKHLMAVNDRDRFGEQTKVKQESSTTVTFIVDTGIRRELAEPAIPIEGRTIEEAGNESNDHQDLDRLPAEAAPALHPLEAEAVQRLGVPPEIWQDRSLHKRTCR